MKRFDIVFLLVVVALGATPESVAAPPAGQGTAVVAKVLRLDGEARITTDGKSWQMLKNGDLLKPGMFVQTAMNDATVDIGWTSAGPGVGTNQFPGFLRLLADGALGVARGGVGAAETDSSRKDVVLRRGKVLGVIGPQLSGEELTIEFPGGVLGMRGASPGQKETVFVLNASGDLKVTAGRVVVTMAADNPVSQVVSAGEQFEPMKGKISPLPPDAPERKLWPIGPRP